MLQNAYSTVENIIRLTKINLNDYMSPMENIWRYRICSMAVLFMDEQDKVIPNRPEREFGMLYGDPNQNFPTQIAKTLQIRIFYPMLVKSKRVCKINVHLPNTLRRYHQK